MDEVEMEESKAGTAAKGVAMADSEADTAVAGHSETEAGAALEGNAWMSMKNGSLLRSPKPIFP